MKAQLKQAPDWRRAVEANGMADTTFFFSTKTTGSIPMTTTNTFSRELDRLARVTGSHLSSASTSPAKRGALQATAAPRKRRPILEPKFEAQPTPAHKPAAPAYTCPPERAVAIDSLRTSPEAKQQLKGAAWAHVSISALSQLCETFHAAERRRKAEATLAEMHRDGSVPTIL